jgi:glucuronokinase
MRRAAAEAFSRAGLVGHPSDAYHGATLACSVKDFGVQAEVVEAVRAAAPEEPLIAATVRRFLREHPHCDDRFAVRATTTIPREVGLAGSSAIVCAVLRALGAYHGVEFAREKLPSLVLAVETEELGIVAGLQDRVAQVYEGLVFMDLDAQFMAQHGHGRYEPLDPALLPPLFLAWRADAAEESTRVHTDLRARFDAGDPISVDGMRELRALAFAARDALVVGDRSAFCAALDGGFDVRARMCALDPRHTVMIDAARALGLPVTYTGSGGAVVGVCEDADRLERLSAKLDGEGCSVIVPSVAPSGAGSREGAGSGRV